ncbi:MAG: hypothetical protein ACOCYT_00240 [Chloroflexota bacterium]
MKRFCQSAMLVLIAALMVLPAMAQDDDEAAPCDIDLSDAAALIVQAQAQAGAGDAEAAVTNLRAVIATLEEAITRCGGTSDTALSFGAAEATQEAAPVTDPESTVFTSDDSGFSFAYPADWIAFQEFNTVFVGTNEQAINGLTSLTVRLLRDEEAAAVAVGPPDTFLAEAIANAQPRDIAAVFGEIFSAEFGYTVDAINAQTIGRFDGQRLDFRSGELAGTLLAFDPAPDDPRLALVIAVAAPDRADDAAASAQAIAESLRVTEAE